MSNEEYLRNMYVLRDEIIRDLGRCLRYIDDIQALIDSEIER